MSTTRETIIATALNHGWHVTYVKDAECNGTIRVERAGVTVRVPFAANGAVKSASRSIATGNVDIQTETETINVRDAGKRETVLSWLVAGVGYPVPGTDVPASSAPVVIVADLSATFVGAASARGHRMRKGHAVTGVLVSVDNSGISHIVRSCCPDGDFSFLPDAPAPAPVTRVDGRESVENANERAAVASALGTHAPTTPLVTLALSYAFAENETTRGRDAECAYFARRHEGTGRTALDVYRVAVERDEDARNPRDDDNLFSWVLTGGRDYLDIDEASGDGIESVWETMTEKYDTGVAFEIVRLYAKIRGAVVFGLARGHDGTVSLHDERHDSRAVRTVPAGRKPARLYPEASWSASHRFVESLNYGVDGIAYVSAATIETEMSAGSTGATIRRNLDGEISTYNSWASGETYGVIVERATVLDTHEAPDDGTTDERELDVNMLEFDGVESCWGYYGDAHGESGLAEFVAETIEHDADTRTPVVAEILARPIVTCPTCGHVTR